MNVSQNRFEPVSQSELEWLGTQPIPARIYFDPDFYERERQAVFMQSWIQVGHVCELPEVGNFITRDIEFAKASVLLVRGRDEQIRAFHNVCTHRGTQLVDEARGRKLKFSCPYHFWTFGADGQLLSAPDFEKFSIDKADCSLVDISVQVFAGLIFVNFAESPTPLQDSLGEVAGQIEALPIARATTFTEYVYDIDANWKLICDNFQENYHLRFIHPQSGGAGVGPGNPFGYATAFDFYGPHRSQTIWINEEGAPAGPTAGSAFQRLAASALGKGLAITGNPSKYFALFPSFFLYGMEIAPFSHMVYPLSAQKSRGVIRIYWVGDDANASERFAREYYMASIRDIHSEDRNVILSGQKGLSSGALKNIHFQTQEALCRHLSNNVMKMVDEYDANAGPEGQRQ